MSKHPGGQDILLGLLGRDATVEFETMRHSQIAFKQLLGVKCKPMGGGSKVLY